MKLFGTTVVNLVSIIGFAVIVSIALLLISIGNELTIVNNENNENNK